MRRRAIVGMAVAAFFVGCGGDDTPTETVTPGSCCALNGTCTVTREALCIGVWTEFGTCDPNQCQQPAGSCCGNGGYCTITSSANCTGGWLMPDGTWATETWTSGGVCDPNPCPQPPPPPPDLDPPADLRVINGSNVVYLDWVASTSEADTTFRRYDVYRGTRSLVAVTPGELASNRIGNVSRGIHSFTDHFGANGVRYFYHVRSEKNDGSLSVASVEVAGAGRDEGTGRIIEEFVSSGDSGFDFSTGEAVFIGSSNPDRFDDTDLYLGTTADDDDPTSPLALKSPELLGRLGNSEWISRNADIKPIGTDFDVATTDVPGGAWVDFQGVTSGVVYAIRTPSGNFAKMKILDIEGPAGARKITFKYAYQPTPNLVLF